MSDCLRLLRRRILLCGTGNPQKGGGPSAAPDAGGGATGGCAQLAVFLRHSASAAKQNVIPGLVIQCVALAIVLLYYLVPSTRFVYTSIGALKAQFGLVYSGVATALFGGLIPLLYVVLSKRTNLSVCAQPGLFCKHLAFSLLFWAWKGVEVDLFYRFQSFLFGSKNTARVIIVKVAVDQFIMNPLWWAWSSPIFFAWRTNDFQPSFVQHVRAIHWSSFLFTTMGTLLSTWMIWIPTCSLVYALPDSLQMPTFNLVLVFWSLFIAAFINKAVAGTKSGAGSSCASVAHTVSAVSDLHASPEPPSRGGDGVKLLEAGHLVDPL